MQSGRTMKAVALLTAFIAISSSVNTNAHPTAVAQKGENATATQGSQTIQAPDELHQARQTRYRPTSDASRMYLLRPGESLDQPIPMPNHRMLAGERESEGAFTLMDVVVEYDIPPHIHYNEDESFYLLSGRLKMFFDGRVYDVEPGSYMFLPRGRPHAVIRASRTPVRLLALSAPAGFEHLPVALANAARERGAPLAWGEESNRVTRGVGWVITPDAFPNFDEVVRQVARGLAD